MWRKAPGRSINCCRYYRSNQDPEWWAKMWRLLVIIISYSMHYLKESHFNWNKWQLLYSASHTFKQCRTLVNKWKDSKTILNLLRRLLQQYLWKINAFIWLWLCHRPSVTTSAKDSWETATLLTLDRSPVHHWTNTPFTYTFTPKGNFMSKLVKYTQNFLSPVSSVLRCVSRSWKYPYISCCSNGQVILPMFSFLSFPLVVPQLVWLPLSILLSLLVMSLYSEQQD